MEACLPWQCHYAACDAEVEAFVGAHPVLCEPLRQLPARLRQYIPDAEVTLEVGADEEDGTETLFMGIHTARPCTEVFGQMVEAIGDPQIAQLMASPEVGELLNVAIA